METAGERDVSIVKVARDWSTDDVVRWRQHDACDIDTLVSIS